MKTYRFDVIIIGAGPAGVAAAGALAGTGISVALVEAGAYAGAENWSGCVYFAENLAEPDCFGPAAVQNAPFERQVVRRGTLVHNGLDEVGVSLTDPAAFRHSYTVLRPIYDPYFAEFARARGAVLITETTVTSLIRMAGSVVGVSTDRGPLYGGVVFLAEGDASHLVRSEGLERIAEPHYLQGVKAVLSLPPEEIEKRFDLRQGEGAAFEILVRNGTISGRTAKLNVGGFLYTNRDSLSLGYVVPLDNLKRNFRGDHSRLLEWMRGLPHLSDLVKDGRLSAYGTKIIRSGGWRERPVLVEDGLAVGGASTGLGIDIPFPNFTGPASASGLYFGRAVKRLLREGRSFDVKNLADAYLHPLQASVYGKNASYLARWPGYFSRTSVLFGRTADVLCGSARFLSSGSIVETARFLRRHMLSLRGIREIATDNLAAVGSLRLWKPLVRTLLHPATIGSWLINSVKRAPQPDPRLRIIMNLGGERPDPFALPWPLGGLLRRTGPALANAIATVYANDGVPAERKFSVALRMMLRSLGIADVLSTPLFGLMLFFTAVGTAIEDAFRYYVLRTPVEKFLSEPVTVYDDSQRKARDLDAVRPDVSLEAKLASNTYHVGSKSHIRTLWPASLAGHADMVKAGLWWVCPARVYACDAPLFGRGRVTVNWENCIKCESCWRAEPGFALWGRFTDHRLIYRPASGAIPLLCDAQQEISAAGGPVSLPPVIDKKLWYTSSAVSAAAGKVVRAASSYREALSALPASADRTRMSWPIALGERLCDAIGNMEKALLADGHQDAAADLSAERLAIGSRVKEERPFHALYAVTRLEQRIAAWVPEAAGDRVPGTDDRRAVSYEEVHQLFPDQVVKQWEDEPMPEEWAEKLRAFVGRHHHPARPAIRALSSVSPALGLIAACQTRSMRIIRSAGKDAMPGLCALDADSVSIAVSKDGSAVKGVLHLVPAAAAKGFLLVANGRGYLIPRGSAGVAIAPTPAVGFRAAQLSDVAFDCTVDPENIMQVPAVEAKDPASYLAIALGAGDYLSRRAQEHAAGRIQFGGQMLDTEGRDGIAKLGAVKAMLARIEAWRMLLETVYDLIRALSHSALRTGHSQLEDLAAAIAALAFGPEERAMAYDAGQVFGGFAYSEDDLLSRFYRDSALFPFLPVGLAASRVLDATVGGKDLEGVLGTSLIALPDPAGKPLGRLVRHWQDVRKAYVAIPGKADPSLRGNASALLLGTAALIAAVEQGLGSGHSPEAEAAACEVLLGLADDAVMEATLSAGRGGVPASAVFPMAPSGRIANLDLDYESFCALPGLPHSSGSFLLSVFGSSPSYVPEMQLHDRDLRRLWEELSGWFKEHCRDKTYDGLSFERHVEKLHELPPEIIEEVKQHKWLATYIPKSEDGLGWRKAKYYILNSSAGSFGDAAVCLLIMASTSIGTTPVLLGLEEELPRVREELEPLARDENRLGEIGSRIQALVASFRNPNPGWIRKEFEAVLKLVDSRIRHTRVVKYLGANFLRSFYGAGLAGQRGDFGGFMKGLEKASVLFGRLLPDVRTALEELPRRERCHKLYLRTLGHGGVAAFALTEPTAGSDSGGVKTTAQLKAAMLSAMPDGRFAFSPTGEPEKCLRYLIDADRIVFTDAGMAYQAPDGSQSLLRHDRYDRSTGQGARYYDHQGTSCEFHDIAQVRRTDKGPVYEYYSVTGSKMWITNGTVATQFSLFAQTAEGVTGFIVDRFAEGLKVGADEKKTGQRGSPTNEISLDSVRVPREAVIGYEGHGQVNALETLNVGRCGLAAVAGALARKVLAEARENIPASAERDRLLGEAAAIQFGSESLAYHLIGLFDRPHESVRMESAIAKYACSEDIHEIISLLEQAYGPRGQTETFLLEKARRDARILNIYEGTNEVQRFLILKDLVAMAGHWPELPEKLSERPEDRRAMSLARWKNRIRRHVRNAAELLGENAWSDAMLQPGLFLLAEMAGEVLRLECTWHRMGWLADRRDLLGEEYAGPLLAAGERAAIRAVARLAHLDGKYARAWGRTSSNLLAAEVHAADALLDRTPTRAEEEPPAMRSLAVPLKVLCIVRPVADISPDPTLDRGALRELLWQGDPADRTGIDQALFLKTAGADVTVHVLLAGGREREDVLRSSGAGADSLFRLHHGPSDAASVAEAVQELESAGQYDIILCGAQSVDGSSGLAPFLAGRLVRSFASVDRIRVQEAGTGLMEIRLPAVVALAPPMSPSRRDIASLIDASARPVVTVGPVRPIAPGPPFYSKPQAAAVEARTITSVNEAASFLRGFSQSMKQAQAVAFTGEVTAAGLPAGPTAWAILDPAGGQANVASLRAAKLAAGLFGKGGCSLIAAPRSLWPELLGLTRANGLEQAFCLDRVDGSLSEEGKRHVLGTLISASGSPTIVVNAGWSDACGFVSGQAGQKDIPFALGIAGIRKDADGYLDVAVSAYGGRLLRHERFGDSAAFLAISSEAEVPIVPAAERFSAKAADLGVEPSWTLPLTPAAEPTLAQAEVIIDLGYGIRDKEGLQLALELKKELEMMGLAPLLGATRKVTQDLKLLPLDAQIGQTGVRVNPKLIIALGVSGAPQHIDWIGTRADVLCFNKDPEAPLMKLNQTRSAPRVHPILGDLFVTVRELIKQTALMR